MRVGEMIGHNTAIFALAKSNEEHIFYAGDGGGWVVKWDVEHPDMGKLVARIEKSIFSLCYLDVQKTIVIGDLDGGVHWVNLENPILTQNIAHHKKSVYDIQFIENQLFTIGGDGVITRWDIKRTKALESLQLSNASLRTMDYNAERNEIAIGSSDYNIYIIDRASFRIKKIITKAHSNSVFSIKYHNKNGICLLLSGGRDAFLKVWNTDTWQQIIEIPAHLYTINNILCIPDEDFFVTASRDKNIKIWNSSTFELKKVIDKIKYKGHSNSVNKLLFLKEKKILVSCSDDRTIKLWKINF